MTTYRISVRDHETDDWGPVHTGLTQWQLRPALRELYRWGYTQMSLQVKAETHDRPAARWDRGFIASTELPRSVRAKLFA